MNVTEPTPEQETHDQEEFDAAVSRDGKLILEWLGGIGVVVALLLSILALTKSADRNTVTITSGERRPLRLHAEWVAEHPSGRRRSV